MGRWWSDTWPGIKIRISGYFPPKINPREIFKGNRTQKIASPPTEAFPGREISFRLEVEWSSHM